MQYAVLDRLTRHNKVSFLWVFGYSEIEAIEKADELAKKIGKPRTRVDLGQTLEQYNLKMLWKDLYDGTIKEGDWRTSAAL